MKSTAYSISSKYLYTSLKQDQFIAKKQIKENIKTFLDFCLKPETYLPIEKVKQASS